LQEDVDFEFSGTDRFEILRRLGAGGMGVVYEALDRSTGITVALKVLRNVSPSTLLRFKQEFRALQDIQHPNLVGLGEFFAERGDWFFTMELVQGRDFLSHVRPARVRKISRIQSSDDTLSLGGVVARRPPDGAAIDEPRLRACLEQLASGLVALHDAGKVHRDIKPTNILVTSDGRTVLLDFGLIAETSEADRSTDARVVGTAAYMAPEQAVATTAEPAADWYSVGILLYEALTGQLPFVGTAFQILFDKQNREPPAPHAIQPDVPADLDRLCVDMLSTEPGARPTGSEVLERVRLARSQRRATPHAFSETSVAQNVPFVGRERELSLLARAFSDMLGREEQVTAFVHGDSGVGKSELLRHFIEKLTTEDEELVLLHGRCYERESVPFKALDGIVDQLSRYLGRIPPAEAAALAPRGAGTLPRVFPVLGRVEAISNAARVHRHISDPRELRRRVFAALRELLDRLGERRSLVLVIDDFQWSDADSLLLLGDLLRPPDAPRMLLLIASREPVPRDDERGETLGIPGDVRPIPLDRMSPPTAHRLARLLLKRADKQRVISAAAIASEALGHPLYINELVSYAAIEDAADRARPRLEDAIWARAGQHTEAARRILEVVCTATVPVSRDTVSRAMRIELPEIARQVSLLRASRLVSTGGVRASDTIEPYHACVREAVMERLDPDTLRDRHERLARALESAGMVTERPQLLIRHFEAAGQIEKAAELAEESARRAARALAFDRAADLYRTALRLGTYERDALRGLRAALGDALANSGRCVDAAQAYLDAAAGADPATRLECQRRAAQQFLISGHIERGLDTLREVLGDVGVSVARTPRRALVSLLWQRFRLRVRGLRWKEKHAAQIAPEALKQLDVFATVSSGLSSVDTIRGADFQSRHLLLALETGEPSRVAVALLHEATFVATQGGRSLRRSGSLLRRARTASAALNDEFVTAWTFAAEGFQSYFGGRFRTAAERFAASGELFRERTVGSVWELNNVRVFRMLSLRHVGTFLHMRTLFDNYVRDAAQRGDRFMETSLRSLNALLFLVRDDAREARDQLRRAVWTPPAETFHVQNWYEIKARTELALYEGNAAAALEELAPGYDRLARAMLLRVQILRAHAHWSRARTLVAAAPTLGDDRGKALAKASLLARRLGRESVEFPHAWSHLIRAAIAVQKGDPESACEHLRQTIAIAGLCQMGFVQAAAQQRLGELLGGDEGAALEASCAEWSSREAIARPDRMLEIAAPGFVPPKAHR